MNNRARLIEEFNEAGEGSGHFINQSKLAWISMITTERLNLH